MRRREQKLWLGTFTDTTPNSTQMGMTSMWRWSPLLQHLHLGLISGAEAAAQPNLIPAPGPGPCAGDWAPGVVESPPCIHPVLYSPWVPGVVGAGKGWMRDECQGQTCCCLKEVTAMCKPLQTPELLYNFICSFNYPKLWCLLIVTQVYIKTGNLISDCSTDLLGF